MTELPCILCRTYHTESERCVPNPWETEARKLARALEWYRANGTVSVKALNDFEAFLKKQERQTWGMREDEA